MALLGFAKSDMYIFLFLKSVLSNIPQELFGTDELKWNHSPDLSTYRSTLDLSFRNL